MKKIDALFKRQMLLMYTYVSIKQMGLLEVNFYQFLKKILSDWNNGDKLIAFVHCLTTDVFNTSKAFILM